MKEKAFTIEFNKLKLGENLFEFELNEHFFRSIEGSEVDKATVVVKLNLNYSESIVDLNFKLHGTTIAICDNCLDEFEYELSNEFNLMLKISEKEDYSDDEIVYITKAVVSYDLRQYLYESFMLSLPSRKVCELAQKKCNQAMAGKIGSLTSTEANQSNENPVWDKLKGIFNKN